jgi:hypothetical protein
VIRRKVFSKAEEAINPIDCPEEKRSSKKSPTIKKIGFTLERFPKYIFNRADNLVRRAIPHLVPTKYDTKGI